MNDEYTRDVHTIALQGNNGTNEHTWSANKELLEFDFAMTTMEVDSEQTFGKTTHENAKTPTMQDELDESLEFPYAAIGLSLRMCTVGCIQKVNLMRVRGMY
nr:hypothetical protein Iba_chr04aCG14400 [Ipomoea batatas]